MLKRGHLKRPDVNYDYCIIEHYTSNIYNSCILRGEPDCSSKATLYFDRVVNYTDTSHCRRLVFVFSWDLASKLIEGSRNYVLVQDSVHLTHHATTKSDYFAAEKDISIPTYRSHHLGRYSSPKRITAYFRGAVHNNKLYSKGIRQQLMKIQSNMFLLREGHSEFYWIEQMSSKYTLCPPGWQEWSPRFFDSILAGSVPVLFEGEEWLIPFHDVIPYRKFVLYCNVNTIVQCIHSDLKNYPTRLRHLMKARRLLHLETNALPLITKKLREFKSSPTK
jgi:hypothetical protein